MRHQWTGTRGLHRVRCQRADRLEIKDVLVEGIRVIDNALKQHSRPDIAGYTSEHLNYIPYTCVIRTGILFYTLEMYNVEHYLLQVLHL